VDTATQNKLTLQCEVLTDSGDTVEDSNGHNDTEATDGTMRGTERQRRDFEDSSGHSDTEPTGVTVCGTDRQWR